MGKKTMKYNPAFLTDEELITGFVIRTKELESILTIIRENTSGPNQHILVEGPRGSGKTTLVRRVAAQVKKDDKLNQQWYPIIFAEESYMVQTPGEFWLEAIFHLEHQTGDPKWGQIYKELKEERDETRLRDGCLAKLIDFADQQKKKLILVVENMQMILGDQLSNDDAWVLRKTLQHEPKIMLLCTSLSGRAEDFKKESKAMYELFKRIDLKPLNDEESKALWEAVAEKPITDNRIRPINILTGGNPRLVSIISEFGANMSFKNLMDNLIQLVDDNTEYFKSHLDSIAPIERKIYLALAEIWDPATAKEVASVARTDVNKTSAVLGRLQQEGRIVIDETKGRKKFYKVAERMYNIYYLMRRRGEPSSRVKPFVHFVILFYGPKAEEMVIVLKSIASEACNLDASSRGDLCCAFGEILRRIGDRAFRGKVLTSVPEPFLNLPETIKALSGSMAKTKKSLVWTRKLNKILDDLKNAIVTDNVSAIKNIKDRYISIYEQIDDLKVKWQILGMINRWAGDYIEAAICYEKVLENKPGHYEALKDLATCYLKSHSNEKAKATYETIINIKNDDLDVWSGYAQVLCDNKEYKSAEKACLRILKEKPEDVNTHFVLVKIYLHLKAYKKAKRLSSKMINLHPEDYRFNVFRGVTSLCTQDYDDAENDLEAAINIRPEDKFVCGFLSIIKTSKGDYKGAIDNLKKAIADKEFVNICAVMVTYLFIILAAQGYSKDLSHMLENSEAKEYLQPLVVALKIYHGEKVIVADEILEVAKDVVKKIEEQAKQIAEKK